MLEKERKYACNLNRYFHFFVWQCRKGAAGQGELPLTRTASCIAKQNLLFPSLKKEIFEFTGKQSNQSPLVNVCQTLVSTSNLTRTPPHTTGCQGEALAEEAHLTHSYNPCSIHRQIQPHCTNTVSYEHEAAGEVSDITAHAQQNLAAPFALPTWDIQLPLTAQPPGALRC